LLAAGVSGAALSAVAIGTVIALAIHRGTHGSGGAPCFPRPRRSAPVVGVGGTPHRLRLLPTTRETFPPAPRCPRGSRKRGADSSSAQQQLRDERQRQEEDDDP
jgi:hypothetical protein